MAIIELNDLSLGQVAGLIAAAIFILQIILPSILPLLLVGFLNEERSSITASAATWSVVSRALQASYWPTVLRTDSAGSTGVSFRVKLITWLGPICAACLAIAAVITPLGLYEVITAPPSPVPEPFHYVQDPSPMGWATLPRSNLGFNRLCGGYPFWLCPGKVVNVSESEYTMYTNWISFDIRIPEPVYDLFSSGLDLFNKSLSSIFDIEYRTYSVQQNLDPTINNGSDYLVGGYRQLYSVLQDDRVELVEGLIVDAHNGGVGFRNHTVPLNSLTYGATWSEDILFIVPETQCVNTNISLDFPLPEAESQILTSSITYLTDRGGFVDIDTNYVYWDLEDIWNDPQNNLDLRERAYKAAWLNNGKTMQFFNITNDKLRVEGRFNYIDSYIGRHIPLTGLQGGENISEYSVDFKAFSSSSFYGSYLSNLLPFPTLTSNSSDSNSTFSNISLLSNTSYLAPQPIYGNPFNVTTDNFTAATILCEGQGGQDLANITNIAVVCGLAFAVARPVNYTSNLSPITFPAGANWTQSIYSCASAAKASIKTVTFQSNGTGGFSDVIIVDIVDKVYQSEADKPIWAVENVNRTLAQWDPLWGITSPQYQGHPNISTIQNDSLWLPGRSDTLGQPFDTTQNIPGANFYTAAFMQAYQVGIETSGRTDYSGENQLSQYSKWFDLSSTEEGTARIINLVWTDFVANGVVGTRGWASESKAPNLAKRDVDQNSGSPLVPIYVMRRHVLFKYRYGIPAFIVCALALVLVGTALGLTIMRKTSVGKLKRYVNHTSFGRGVASMLYPESFTQEFSKSEWERQTANKQIIIGKERPLAAEEDVYRHKDDAVDESLLKAKVGRATETELSNDVR